MEKKLVSIHKIIDGLKTYVGSIVGTKDLMGLSIIAFVNTFVQTKVPMFLQPLAINDELDLDIVKQNVIEAMEQLPEKKLTIPVPFTRAKFTLDTKAINDIYDIIIAQ